MTAFASFTSSDNRQVLQAILPNGIPVGLVGRSKRILDVMIAFSVLLFLFPLLVVLAILIKLQDGGPVLYRHRRCGQGGQHFVLYKFRTMRIDADKQLDRLLQSDQTARRDWQEFRKLRQDPRVTKLGLFLRRSSLDELPQLFNVLIGNMSLVGPRPIVDEELARFGALSAVYDAAKPGITGLWQISGRNKTSFDTRILLDAKYVREWSMKNDVAILIKTIPVVLLAKGAY